MSIVTQFLQHDYHERIQQFSPDVCAIETAVARMADWRESGALTVFMAGTFDIPTPNHRLGLAEARLMGGAAVCDIEYPPQPDSLQRVMKAAASNLVRFMVTLDTDEGAGQSKGFNPEKGDCPRPILSWSTRALNVASYSVPQEGGAHHTMVDFITRHGPNACQACTDCTSNDNARMVVALQPDLVVINAASTATLETVVGAKERGILPVTMIGITNEGDHQVVDELLGGRVSGTAVVRRIKGEIGE